MKIQKIILIFFFIFVFTGTGMDTAFAQSSKSTKNQERVLVKKLIKAMDEDDIEQIESLSNEIKILLGEKAGTPKYPDRIQKHIDPEKLTVFNQTQIRDNLYKVLEKIDFASIEYLSKGEKTPNSRPSVLLRESARLISLAIMVCQYNIMPEISDICRKYARIGLNNLMQLQLSDGSFPTPDFRGTSHKLSQKIEKLLKQGLIKIENGWCVKDLGFGGFQMSTAIIGNTMLKAYYYFHDQQYLNCAVKAGNWEKNFKTVINWNYNAFSADLLAGLYSATHRSEYIDVCIHKMKTGVFPGQSKNGRWVDTHNALLQYHIIIMNALLNIYPALHEHKYDLVKNRLCQVIEKGMEPIITKNIAGMISKPSDLLVILLRFEQYFGTTPNIDLAVQVNLNAIIDSIKHIDNPKYPKKNVARALIIYLSQFRKNKSPKLTDNRSIMHLMSFSDQAEASMPYIEVMGVLPF